MGALNKYRVWRSLLLIRHEWNVFFNHHTAQLCTPVGLVLNEKNDLHWSVVEMNQWFMLDGTHVTVLA